MHFNIVNDKLFRIGFHIKNKAGISVLSNEDYLNIFHEIKNSITLINSSLQLVAKKHPEVGSFDYWNETMSEINFLKNMITQLSSARLCNHLNLCCVDSAAFMEQIKETVSLFSQDFHCELIMQPNLPQITIDPQLIRQGIINLVKNAHEAMGCTGTVKLEVRADSDSLCIAVTDYGGGLDPALAAKIFEPFITSKNGGSGLGLVITRQIVESHHGTLECDSRPGDGCTFTITLPLTQN